MPAPACAGGGPVAARPHRRRGDPGLRQSTHPEQIGQVGGVAYVVLHPPVGEPFTLSGWARCTAAPRRRARRPPSTSRRSRPAPPVAPVRPSPPPRTTPPDRWRTALPPAVHR